MGDEGPSTGISFVPCVKWIRRGVSKTKLEKVQLTEEELEALINQTKSDLKDTEEEEETVDAENEENASGDKDKFTEEEKENVKVEDEYNFHKYDEEGEVGDALLGIGNLVVYASTSSDPYVTLKDDEDNDSEKGDDEISPEDNLILVGRVEADASILEVYVYNEEEGSLYVHHDLLLPAFPLCLEWLSYDPGDATPGNLCAVGSMSPIIEVWDLDVVDCLESAFKLGNKPKKKAGIKRHGHKDAVLDLAWNANVPHVLASGSVDQTVLLWDLDTAKVATTLTPFTDKVQSLQWHPFEGQTLLTGSCDSMARVFDCRIEGSFKSWQVEGEVERVLWNQFEPFCFFVSTSMGGVHYIDCRSDKPLWQLAAHNKEVSGLTLSSQCPSLLLTASNDGQAKAWDIESSAPVFVSERNLGIGAVQCMSSCPDAPYVMCAGGDKKNNSLLVWDVVKMDAAVERRFAARKLLQATKCEVPTTAASTSEEQVAESMDTADMTSEAFESLSLEQTLGESLPKKSPKYFQGSKKKGRKKLKK